MYCKVSLFDNINNKPSMNVTMAPFLYTMNELPAFYCYINFIQNICPTYVQPNLGIKAKSRNINVFHFSFIH